MDKTYSEIEKIAYKLFSDIGLHEAVAKDCIVSRNEKQLETIVEFIGRYGNYFLK
jgi:hypothetical protein